MAFSAKMRENNVDLFVTNRLDWGHLISADKFNTSHIYNELYEMVNNRWDWEKRYLHANYSQNLDPNINVTQVTNQFPLTLSQLLKHFLFQPCYNVFWFPMLTERFCDELVNEMENFGQWILVGDESVI